MARSGQGGRRWERHATRGALTLCTRWLRSFMAPLWLSPVAFGNLRLMECRAAGWAVTQPHGSPAKAAAGLVR